MSRTKTFQKSILSLLLLLSISSCTIVKPLIINDIEKLSIKEMSFSYIDIEVYLPIQNPNPFNFRITEIDLNASINGLHLGTITEKQIIPIKGNSIETIRLPLRVQTKDLFSGALNFILNYSDSNSKLKLDGTIEVKIWFFSKTITINQETQMLRPKSSN